MQSSEGETFDIKTITTFDINTKFILCFLKKIYLLLLIRVKVPLKRENPKSHRLFESIMNQRKRWNDAHLYFFGYLESVFSFSILASHNSGKLNFKKKQ